MGSDVEPLVQVDGDGVLVETIKLANDGTGDIVVRLYESFGCRSVANVRGNFAYSAIIRTDLLENPEVDQPQSATGGFSPTLRPFELVTFRFVRSDTGDSAS